MFKKINNRIMPTILLIILTFSFSIIPAQAKTELVIPGGESFGLKLYCKGVMIVKIENFISENKKVSPALDSGLKVNDIILSVNNDTVKSNEELENAVGNSKGKEIKLKIERNNNIIYRKITPKLSGKKYKLGIWVKDSCAGIGTISFYNPKNKTYAALGHGICDNDTGRIIPNGHGEILYASITSIKKSEYNKIGTLNGYFTDNSIGNIKSNTPIGIFGKFNKPIKKQELYKTAEHSDIKPGDAYILTTIEGTKPKKYSIKVLSICNTSKNSNRNFIIQITDKRLINKTGGIVQGMSGSPIIQNGKIIGAVTHVFLEDSKKGYGIFAENMI